MRAPGKIDASARVAGLVQSRAHDGLRRDPLPQGHVATLEEEAELLTVHPARLVKP